LRILLLVDCYYPSPKSSAKLVHDLAAELASRGHEPVVLTPSESTRERIEISEEDAITVARVRTGQIKGARKLQRGLREARLSSVVWSAAKQFLSAHPCELILFYSPTIFFGRLVARLKSMWQCPSYMILRDIFPEWAADAGVLRRGLIYRYFKNVARRQYHAADLIAVQSPANLGYFSRNFPYHEFRLEVLYNWTASAEEALPRTTYRERLGLNGKVVFLYGGNIGVAQDMDNLMRLAQRFEARNDVSFLLVGEGTEVPRLRRKIESERIANVQILEGLRQEEYLAMVSEFDVGLISLDARLTTHNIPGKLMSYLFWGMPVLASVNSGNDLLACLEESGAGACVANGDDEALYRAALRLVEDADARDQMGRAARQLLEEKFSVENAADSIFQHLESHGLLKVRSATQLPLNAPVTAIPEFAARQ
jgi:O26-antigen biosynthesis N-acetyl-L-fucosamine transferase